jgi:hypothetical protein
MASVAVLGTSVFNTTAGDKTITATPTLGTLILIIACATGVTGGAQGAVSVSDNQTGVNAATYVKAGSTQGGFSTTGGLDIWVRNKLITSNASTVFTAVQTSSTGGGLVIYAITGMSIVGLGAVRQAGGTTAGTLGTTPSGALIPRLGSIFTGSSLAALTGNVVIGAVANGTSPATVTPPTSWTEAPTPDLGYTVPTTGLETAFINSGFTGSTPTWGSTSATAWASCVVEMDASVPQYDWVTRNQADSDRIISKEAVIGRANTWMKGARREWRRAKSGILVPELAF